MLKFLTVSSCRSLTNHFLIFIWKLKVKSKKTIKPIFQNTLPAAVSKEPMGIAADPKDPAAVSTEPVDVAVGPKDPVVVTIETIVVAADPKDIATDLISFILLYYYIIFYALLVLILFFSILFQACILFYSN